ncbi:unnamed protein product [Ambrosiozyma monospora]|uniref:Unnamed protein product n=1 Tax=Ambrosiozyma monospora TaxID=43982 RepID=A0A9W6YU99_AMBMO|nr:unnamed protein product [Ambrosiozyma monospora]
METTTQRVWDYAGDNYVHRLIQNEADGKLVELPLRTNKNNSSTSLSSEEHEAKVEKIGFEYSKMLISQLESQREFYDSRYFDLVNKFQIASDDVTKLEKLVSTLTHKVEQLNMHKHDESKVKHALETSKDAENKLKEEMALNQALSDKIEFLTTENEKIKKEKEELQEQVNDLMFYLESQEKFKDASDDVKEGQIIMRPSHASSKKKKGRRR